MSTTTRKQALHKALNGRALTPIERRKIEREAEARERWADATATEIRKDMETALADRSGSRLI